MSADAGQRYALAALLAGLGTFVWATLQFSGLRLQQPNAEIRVALPIPIQIVLMAGDRYLAANWSSIRALVTETARMQEEEYRILAQVQQDGSWMNPAHEDNYYTAAAILPWNGELDAAQIILRRAATARPFDYQPAFFLAFNLMHYKGDVMAAAETLRAAATKLPDPDERLAMENLAAKWMDRSKDLAVAIGVVDAMAKQARRPDFRKYLETRSKRLRSLKQLREAAAEYVMKHGHPPSKLSQLVEAGMIDRIPADPFGFGFGIDSSGNVVLLNTVVRP